MNSLFLLIKPRILSIKNKNFSKNNNESGLKLLFLLIAGFLFWGGVLAISLRVLLYFKGIEQLGDILAYKLLSMMLLIIFSLLIFSSILTSLSKLYISRDLSLVHSLPVPGHRIYTARWIESTVDSSWMVIVYSMPVLIAYGITYHSGVSYYIMTVLTIIFLSVSASAISAILVMLSVIIIPANRLKSIFIFLGLFLFIALFLAFRLLRPERLVDPEAFATTLVYLNALKTDGPPYLPSTWAYDGIKLALSGNFMHSFFHLALSFSCAITLLFASIIIADLIYFKGLSKSHTAHMKLIKYFSSGISCPGFLSRPAWAFVIKEIKIFFRDQTQWSQILLIGGLVVVYIYNFSVLPLEKSPVKTFYLQNILAFLNMGLAAFVLTAVTARFAFPAVSIEKEAFWIVVSAPIPNSTYLWIKFTVYFLPLLVLTEILIVATNIMLDVTPFMMGLSVITILFIVPGIVSLGIGIGAAYPDFKSENPAQMVTSFGGFLFMIISACFIGVVIILEAGPVYQIFMAEVQQRLINHLEWMWIFVSFLAAFVLSILAVVIPMRFGEKSLEKGMI